MSCAATRRSLLAKKKQGTYSPGCSGPGCASMLLRVLVDHHDTWGAEWLLREQRRGKSTGSDE